jgi:outer membrane protein OmpA-like peptidoglycan-associated protein
VKITSRTSPHAGKARIGLLLAVAATCASVAVAGEPIDIGLVQDVVVVARHVPTINFRAAGSSGMHVPLVGTSLAPGARGEMGIDSKKGYAQLQANIKGLPSAATFGDEYMTYVLWAITPEGRATNLGEFLVESSKESEARLEVTSELQAFGLVVTAEPHYSVTIPSNVVVMESGIPDSGSSRVQTVDAEYQLLERGTYSFRGESRTGLEVPSVPFYVVQARNARRIAIDAGGRTYAVDAMTRGEEQLHLAEADSGKNRSTSARQSAQIFEDARLISVEAARKAREASSNLNAAKAQHDASAARADATDARADATDARADAAIALDQAGEAQAKLDDAQRAQHEAELRATAAEADKAALRARLRDQLALIFETRDSARGLIVNMSDVLFAFGKDALQPEAREKLAKLAGVLLSNPGLHLDVEGHADSIGGDAYNQGLSERRASSVADYLVAQMISAGTITSRGFGESQPVATNDTDVGRALNRRVEIVLSGDVIGQAASLDN